MSKPFYFVKYPNNLLIKSVFSEIKFTKLHFLFLKNSLELLIMKFYFWPILAYSIINTIQIGSKFGLLTVTNSQNQDYSIIQKYIKTYTQTQCYTEMINQINIVWNNELLPQQTSIFNESSKWKIPVYFYLPTFDSIDHRFRLPKQSTSNLFFSLEDNILIDCQTFKNLFEEYKKEGDQKIGRILTNQVKGFKFEPSYIEYAQFYYQQQQSTNYFTISSVASEFIPRHFLQIYYLRIIEFLELRNQVIDFKQCQNIFFYAFVQHFYPELPAVYLPQQKIQKKIGQTQQMRKNLLKAKNRCISDISKFFGYNPLRFYCKDRTQFLKNWRYGNITLKMILQQKQRGLSELETQKRVQKDVDEYLQNKQKSIKQQQLIEEKLNKPKNEQRQQAVAQIQQPKELINQNQSGKIQVLQKSLEQSNFQFTFQQKIFTLFLLILLLLCGVLKLYKNICNKKKRHRIRINQEEQAQFSSKRLPESY